jgi:hypothetical protein
VRAAEHLSRVARMLEKQTGTMFGKNDEQIDVRGLLRLGSWGAAATGALLVAVLAIQSDTGARRAANVFSPEPQGAPQLARKQELEADTKRLTESVRALSADRDRLLARVTVLERNLEDVTGSVGRIGNAQSTTAQSSPLPPAQLPAGPSVISSISVPQMISSFPSNRIASGFSAARGAAPAPDSIGAMTDFGVDIGGGPTIEALRDLWISAKGTHGSIFDGLRPVISVRDGKPGTSELRLVVGPLSNAAAAAKICASLAASGWTCRPAVFDGQRLALR